MREGTEPLLREVADLPPARGAEPLLREVAEPLLREVAELPPARGGRAASCAKSPTRSWARAPSTSCARATSRFLREVAERSPSCLPREGDEQTHATHR